MYFDELFSIYVYTDGYSVSFSSSQGSSSVLKPVTFLARVQTKCFVLIYCMAAMSCQDCLAIQFEHQTRDT